jgi:PPM family protein phosphatase
VIGRIQKIFSKQTPKTRISTPEDTIPLSRQPISETQSVPVPPHSLEPPQLFAVCGQSVGIQRDHNEDALLALTTTLVSDDRHIPFGLYIIADGMGGHKNGEVASAIAVRSVASHVNRNIFTPLFSISDTQPESSVQEVLHEAVLEAHQTILNQSLGGGTTLTAALILGDQLTISHVGDSRAYIINPDGSMEALTRDHSLVMRLEELGQITREEAAVHPQRNVLYRALGQGDPFDPDIITAPLPHNGFLLICSDGLWGVLEQSHIQKLITTNPDMEEACRKLIEAANDAGGPDNISAILVRVPETDQ